ncbi:MAG TPA: PIN domain-containing protein [Acidimicrobiales bacterium]|nr:PIN domain-containing protein [Acidimicrobiales bacterium]
MILLDSNVLVYAVGRGHPLAPVAEDLLRFGETGRFRITARVLEEFAHVHSRGGRARIVARDLAAEFSASLGPVEFATEEDFASAFDLWVVHERLGLADAVLAAMAKRLDAQLVSADRHFGAVENLRFVNFADPDLRERLDVSQS